MTGSLQGNAHVLGDHVNTDLIIPGKYTKTLNMAALAEHVLEDLDPPLASPLERGDILVAGRNFGCGSSREQAPLALKAAGVAAVVARDFARIFYRNAINIGLPVLEVDWSDIQAGDRLDLDLARGLVRNLGRPGEFRAAPLSPAMLAILEAGGLAAYLKAHGDFPA